MTNTQVEAVDELNRTIPNGIYYTRPKFVTPPSRGYVELRIDPDEPDCIEYDSAALAYWGSWSSEHTHAVIIYCSEEYALRKSTVLHELGHTFGLRHSSTNTDLMCIRRRVTQHFSPREKLLMKLTMQRRGGNRFPDNDRQAFSAPVGESILFKCYE